MIDAGILEEEQQPLPLWPGSVDFSDQMREF